MTGAIKSGLGAVDGAMVAVVKKMRVSCADLCRPVRAKLAARCILGDQQGATAVEFALVATPFFALIFAILETALVFFAGQTLETAAADGARLIMTGQAQTAGYDQAAFKRAVCAKIVGLIDCNAGLYIDVKSYASFSSINTAAPITNGALNTTGFGFVSGGPGDIVVVRLMYQWPVYAALLSFNLSNSGTNKRLLMSTVAFRNEPYK